MAMSKDEMDSLIEHLGDPADHDTGDTVSAGSGLEPLTPGQMVKSLREIDELTQEQLAEATGIPQATISGIEGGRIKLGLERVKVLARALHVHPSVIAFSDWRGGEAEYGDDGHEAA